MFGKVRVRRKVRVSECKSACVRLCNSVRVRVCKSARAGGGEQEEREGV